MKKNNKKIQILVVEDDHNLSSVLGDYLEMLGYEVILAGDGDEGLQMYHQNHPDLCILDIMMPRKDGFTLAREIRISDQTVPIIFLTAKGLKEDRINGFKSGCDDYIIKPFSSEELSLRINAILKRCYLIEGNEIKREHETFTIGKYTFDTHNLILTSGSYHKTLTRKEAALLKLLCLNRNQLLSREEAFVSIWGNDDYFIGRSMDVFITKLRKYLKDDPDISISNVHGAGFRLEVKE